MKACGKVTVSAGARGRALPCAPWTSTSFPPPHCPPEIPTCAIPPPLQSTHRCQEPPAPISRPPTHQGNLFHSTFTPAQPGLSSRRKTPGGKNPGSFSTPLSTSVPETDIYFSERVTTRASLICPEHFVDQTEEHSPGSRTILAQHRETPAGPRCCSETRNHLAVQRLRKEIVTLETSRARHQQLPGPGGCCPRSRRMLDADSEGPTPSAGREREESPQEQQLQQQPRDPSRGWSLRSRFSFTAVRREGIQTGGGGVGAFLPSPLNAWIADPSSTPISTVSLRGVLCQCTVGSVHEGVCSPHLPAVGHSKAPEPSKL